MLRQTAARHLDHDPRFEWRGEAVKRLENLSDIVFALALGMLVSAATPPETYGALQAHLIGVIPVAAGFFLMVMIWHDHFTFFRRYGLGDTTIIFLNAALLLVVLFVAYPLRFIFDSLFAWILGMAGDWSRMEAMGISDYRQAGVIMAYFNLGYFALYGLIGWMYAHARSKADSLGLSPTERALTTRSVWACRVHQIMGLTTAGLAGLTVIGPSAGFIFWLLWPAMALVDRVIKLPLEDTQAV